MTHHVLIIGGGAIGLSLAWELRTRGAKVTLLERDAVGRQASWAGAGILPPPPRNTHEPVERLRFLSHQLHPIWAQRLRNATGIDTGLRRCGGIYLAFRPGEAATLAAQALDWSESGIEVERWSIERLKNEEPELAVERSTRDGEPCLAAYHLADEWQLRNPHHLQALDAICRQMGVEIQEGIEVNRIDFVPGQGRVASVSAKVTQGAEQRWKADQFVLCGGAWTDRWLRELGYPSSIYPVRGQMLLYRGATPFIRRIVNEGNRYVVPRADGRLLVGSSEEEVGFREGTTPEVLDDLRRWATSRIPRLAECEIESSWSGFRPATVDGLPYLGKFPEFDNLYIAAGHYRSGLHLSPGSAVCLADVMTGGVPPIEMTPFAVTRGFTAIHPGATPANSIPTAK